MLLRNNGIFHTTNLNAELKYIRKSGRMMILKYQMPKYRKSAHTETIKRIDRRFRERSLARERQHDGNSVKCLVAKATPGSRILRTNMQTMPATR